MPVYRCLYICMSFTCIQLSITFEAIPNHWTGAQGEVVNIHVHVKYYSMTFDTIRQ